MLLGMEDRARSDVSVVSSSRAHAEVHPGNARSHSFMNMVSLWSQGRPER